jgi:hypothetical protein
MKVWQSSWSTCVIRVSDLFRRKFWQSGQSTDTDIRVSSSAYQSRGPFWWLRSCERIYRKDVVWFVLRFEESNVPHAELPKSHLDFHSLNLMVFLNLVQIFEISNLSVVSVSGSACTSVILFQHMKSDWAFDLSDFSSVCVVQQYFCIFQPFILMGLCITHSFLIKNSFIYFLQLFHFIIFIPWCWLALKICTNYALNLRAIILSLQTFLLTTLLIMLLCTTIDKLLSALSPPE